MVHLKEIPYLLAVVEPENGQTLATHCCLHLNLANVPRNQHSEIGYTCKERFFDPGYF